MNSTLERDLMNKLVLDVKRACLHFTDTCDVVDIPAQSQWANMVYALSVLLIELVLIGSSTPKDFFLSMLASMWDKRASKRTSK